MSKKLHYSLMTWYFKIRTSQMAQWVKNAPAVQETRRCGFNPWIRTILWRRKKQPTSAFLPEKSHGQRTLVGYSPQGHKEIQLSTSTTFLRQWKLYTISWALRKLMSIESVMPSNNLFLCCSLLFCPQSFSASGSFSWWSQEKKANSSHQVTKVLGPQLQHQSFQWIFRVVFF